MKKIAILLICALCLNAENLAINALKKGYNAKIIGQYALINGEKIMLNLGDNPPLKTRQDEGCQNSASIMAMMSANSYSALAGLNAPLDDSTRCRNYELLGAVYGKSEAEVRANLVKVDFLGHMVEFNKNNGASKALQEVANELKTLVQNNPEFAKFLQNIGGTFKWRKIAGTNQLSAHSYAIAVDINVKYSSYWRWSKSYKNQIPQAIVHAFERHKFIWGGRWKHFDTMHFEYRPEYF
ncbi:M15 family metallopeptidase [Campylobacter sp. 19-13652]|uniref:M15 family metallopeptidase n=1 Tax=Campylobacter sp. 19-13652 TaxID=2840180 RepID=UPI001C73F66B|nr:M15 family metallopeptidase [Campylobacter sp. 19-13652]BCX80025.1 hypothetical protein LBC_14870 [Campylobacter sp. 19-13652]